MDLAERCRIHADKMDGEGWYVTANVLWEASKVLSGRGAPELPAVHSYMRCEANQLRQEAAVEKRAGEIEAMRKALEKITKAKTMREAREIAAEALVS